MMNGPMMQQKEVFEKHFKIEFLSMINDRVSNVRIQVAKVIKHHFLKEISGAFVYDSDMNDAVKLLKQDLNVDVQYIVSEIEPTVKDDNKNLTMDSFLKTLEDQKRAQHSDYSGSECESSYSEDEFRIEAEIRRHNSEDDIDHGPVLQSLRKQREQQRA